MLTNDQQYILSLLRKSLQVNPSFDGQPEDVGCVEKTIWKNGILLTVYGVLREDIKKDLYLQYTSSVKQSVLQEYEGERALNALSDAGMDCIALKGWEMRKLYPNINMRQMADLDILVRPYRYSHIKTIMQRLGYTSSIESSWKHDSFRKGEVHVEMHKRLTDDSDQIQKWEREIWSRAIPVEGKICKMTSEDYYIFHFVHLHKDFMNGSLGLRRLVDTWLLQKQERDMDAIRRELERFGIWKFHERMVALSRAVMGDAPIDENCEILLAHAFRHGIYGSEISYKAGRIAKMGGTIRTGKINSAVSAVFLPYSRMKAQFPVLEKWPILLPWCWFRRIAHFLRGDTKHSRAMLDYSKINEKEFEEAERFFQAGGVR